MEAFIESLTVYQCYEGAIKGVVYDLRRYVFEVSEKRKKFYVNERK